MSKTYHFICEIQDSINKYKVVSSVYVDISTPLKAKKYFLKHPQIKKYLKNMRYQITMRQNCEVLQYPE